MSAQHDNYSKSLGDNLLILEVITNSMSVVGSLFIVTMYLCYKDLRSFAYKLVMLLAAADIIFGVARMFTFEQYFQDEYSPELDFSCYAQAYLTTFGGLSTIIATMAISWSLTQSVVYGVNELDIYSKWYYFAIFIIPLLISIIPLATGDYGISSFSCWIADKNGNIKAMIWRLSLFYIPLWFSTIYNFMNYFRIWKFVDIVLDEDEGETSQRQRSIIKKLTLYPLIMVVCYFFSTVDCIYSFFSDQEPSVIAYLHISLAGLQGVFNSLVYGFNKQIKKKLGEIFRCRCLRSEQEQQSDRNLEKRSESPSRNFSSSSSIESSLTENINDRSGGTLQKYEQDSNLIYNNNQDALDVKLGRKKKIQQLSEISYQNEDNSTQIRKENDQI